MRALPRLLSAIAMLGALLILVSSVMALGWPETNIPSSIAFAVTLLSNLVIGLWLLPVPMTTKGLVVAFEANFDGLVGLTHNYGGLSTGNLASAANATAVSRPKEGALQGLAKAKRLADAGLVQGLLPPHERPHLPTLKAI
eukprot:gene7165-8595_t